MLTPAQRASWNERGRVVLRSALDDETVASIDEWIDQVATWSTMADGPGLHHFEQTIHGPALARSEDFDPHHRGLSDFMRSGVIATLLSSLFGEAPTLFKEKVNHKAAGGAGFAPHQDATAYRFAERHISVMVPLDAATEASGCLWFADAKVEEILPNDAGRIDDEWVASVDWVPVEVGPGDLVAFDGFAPHRSGTNSTERSRRVMYLTYNASSEGDHRGRYYEDKRAAFADAGVAGESGKVLISINDDFLGVPVGDLP